MNKQLVSSGSEFEQKIGYSRAVIQGNWVFVSGTTGYNYTDMSISNNIIEQTEQCFINITEALKEANSSLKDIVRVTYILPKVDDFEKCWPILNKYLGAVKPAATMFSAGLADDSMKIEIEVTALK
ncbi:RidA family protein [Wenyingzhuangia sp. IMCC45533]